MTDRIDSDASRVLAHRLPSADRLKLRVIDQDSASAFIAREHRHNKRRLPGWKFGTGLYLAGELVGVGVAGRCSSRVLDQRGAGHFIEVRRVATNGTGNGCSKLYGALLRAARAIGYCRAYTYTLAEESGASLKATGWVVDEVLAAHKSGGWDCPSRPRDETDWPEGAKVRWVNYLDNCEQHPRPVMDEPAASVVALLQTSRDDHSIIARCLETLGVPTA